MVIWFIQRFMGAVISDCAGWLYPAKAALFSLNILPETAQFFRIAVPGHGLRRHHVRKNRPLLR
jgi:hypothetical protein